MEGSRDNSRGEAGSHGADSPLLTPRQEHFALWQLFLKNRCSSRLSPAHSLVLRSSKLLEVKKTSKLQSYQSDRPQQPLVTVTPRRVSPDWAAVTDTVYSGGDLADAPLLSGLYHKCKSKDGTDTVTRGSERRARVCRR